MPPTGSSEVAQRRFWNMLRDVPGIMYVAGGAAEGARLRSDTGFDEPLSIFNNGPIVFPPEHKLARTWTFSLHRWTPTLGGVDYDGPSAVFLKPYSTKFNLVGGDRWMYGDDWDTANLFYDTCPFAMPTTLKYHAYGDTPAGTRDPIAPIWAYNPGTGAQGFGAGGRLYGYNNDVYFGNNEMGMNKPNVGIGPQTQAVGDMSKTYAGLWGAFGLSHGTCINAMPWACQSDAEWAFDLCYRPQMMLLSNFNNQVFHLNEDVFPTEGWGTEMVALHDATVEFDNGTQETYRQFTTDVSPARSTINVYTVHGVQLIYGEDYTNDDCDKSGRSYRLIDWWEERDEHGNLLWIRRNTKTNPEDICMTMFVLVVTYLVTAANLQAAARDARQTDTNVAHDRLQTGDIRGL